MLRRGGALLLAICCTAGPSSAGTDPCTPDTPPCSAPTGVLTFADDFHSLDFHRWMTTYPWGKRNLAGPGGSGELQEYVEPSYRHLGLNPFSIGHDGCPAPVSGGVAAAGMGAPPVVPGPAPGAEAAPPCHTPVGSEATGGGRLSIRADRVAPALSQQLDGRAYTSGLLTTFHSFAQKYGYFEMRARLPYGRGLWPAFWLLPLDKSWPPEIDVMEVLGQQPTTLYVTVHTKGPGGKDRPTGFELHVPDMTVGFHRYGVLWTPSFLAWYFDGQRVAYTAAPKDLTRPMYLLVNLAVGGKWAGAPDATTQFPATMQIDTIRAYRLPPDMAVQPARPRSPAQ